MANITSANNKARAEQVKKQYKRKSYEPVKAHEYYMKHRKLKGRKKKASTKSSGKASTKKKVSKKDALSEEGLSPEQLLQAKRAKAEMAIKKKEFQDKLKEQIKQRNAEIDADPNLSDYEKKVQKQMLADTASEVKKKGNEILDNQLIDTMTKLKKGSDSNKDKAK